MNSSVFNRSLFQFLILALIFLPRMASAGLETNHPILKGKSHVTITGTSTLHDWEIKVSEFSGWVAGSNFSTTPEITQGKLVCQVKSFQSGKKSMDKVVFDAMKESTFPEVIFEFNKTLKSEVKGDTRELLVEGNLTIAGTTRKIQLTLKGKGSTNSFELQGNKSFKMSEFNVPPPSAMFGTVKSGDEIRILFNIHFQIN